MTFTEYCIQSSTGCTHYPGSSTMQSLFYLIQACVTDQEKGVIIIQCGHWCNDIFKMRHFRLKRFHNFTKPQGLGCQWFLWPITEHWRPGPGRNLPGWGLHFSQLSTMSPKAEERTAIPHTHMANLFQCIHWCHNITPRGPFNEERNGGKRGRDRRRKQRRKRRKVGSTELC